MRAVCSVIAGMVGGQATGYAMMFTCEGACGGGMWSCAGGTKLPVGAFLMHVTIALAFITAYWFLCIFDDYHSGVGDENAV